MRRPGMVTVTVVTIRDGPAMVTRWMVSGKARCAWRWSIHAVELGRLTQF